MNLAARTRLLTNRIGSVRFLDPQMMVLVGGIVLLLAFLVLAPLLGLLWLSFTTVVNGERTFSLSNYAEAYLNPSSYPLLLNTLIFSIGSVGIGTAIAVTFAWLVERTNTPFRNFGFAMIIANSAVPSVLFGIAWIILLSDRTGILNMPFTRGLGWTEGPLTPFSMVSMIFVESLRIVPTAFLIMVGLFRSMDPALEEAATVSGANPASVARRITLRIMLPGILGVVIYSGTFVLGAFEIPALMGMPAEIYVFATRTFRALEGFPPDYGLASALAMFLVVVGIIGIFLYHRLIRGERFATITGKGFRPRGIDLGRWRYLGTVFIFLYFLLAVALPLLVIVWLSLHPFYRAPSLEAFGSVNLEAYRILLDAGYFWSSLRATAIVVFAVPLLTMFLSAIVSWVVVRSKLRGRTVVDGLAFLPHTIPSIVLGLAFLVLFLFVLQFIPIYGTIWIIVVALTISYLAYGTRTTNAGMAQIHRELEEAGYASGAGWWPVFRKITVRLLVPALVAGWLWVAIHAGRELTIALLLSSHGNEILSVLIWTNWQGGDVDQVGAIGVMLIAIVTGLFVLGRWVTVRLSRYSS